MSTDVQVAMKAKRSDEQEPTKGRSNNSDMKANNKVSISKYESTEYVFCFLETANLR